MDESNRKASVRPRFGRVSSTYQMRAVKVQAAELGRFHSIRGVVLLALSVIVIWLNLTFLKPLIMGGVFATVLYPLMGKMQENVRSRTLRSTIITIGFAVAFLLPIGVILYLGAEALIEKLQNVPGLNLTAPGQISPRALVDMLGIEVWVRKIVILTPLTEAQIYQALSRGSLAVGGYLINGAQALLASLPGIAFANVIILMTIFFLLIDGPRTVAFIRRNSIFGPKQTDKIFSTVSALCYSVVVASIVSGAVQSSLVAVACLITGVPNVVLILLVTFIFSFFPVFGTLPVTLTLTASQFMAGNITGGIIMLVFMGIVSISDNIVRPYVLKGGAELHPLVGFVAAFGALDVIGFYGLFIGPIVAGLFFAMLPMVTKTYGQQKNSIG